VGAANAADGIRGAEANGGCSGGAALAARGLAADHDRHAVDLQAGLDYLVSGFPALATRGHTELDRRMARIWRAKSMELQLP